MLKELSIEAQTPVLEHMQRSASKHALRSNGLLVAMDLNPVEYPHQLLTDSALRHDNELAATESLHPIATLIRPRYPKLMELIEKSDQLTETSASSGAITKSGNLLEDKTNVDWSLDHGEDVITFIMNAVAAVNVVRDRGINFRGGYIGSKMMDFLAIDLNGFGAARGFAEQLLIDAGVVIEDNGIIHTRNILARVFHNQYFVVPNTQTTAEFRKTHDLIINTHGKFIRTLIRTDMVATRFRSKPSLFLINASPGALNKPLDVNEYHKRKRAENYDFDSLADPKDFSEGQVEVIGAASNGMITFLRRAESFAAVAKMQSEIPFFKIDPAPIKIKTSDDIREIGRKQIALLDKAEPNIIHVYDASNSLPVLEPGF